jgi:hypothetical protein
MSFSGKSPLTTTVIINNDGFWPALIVGDLTEKYRVPAEYADATLHMGIVIGMLHINERLLKVRLDLNAKGFATLADYTATLTAMLNDEPVLLVHYKHAVYSHAKAWLLQQFNSMNRKPEAENAAKESPETEQWWLDQAQASIKSIFADVLPDESVAAKAGFKAVLI